MLTITVILAIAALVLSIAAAAGRWTPIALPVAVILLAIAILIQRIPAS